VPARTVRRAALYAYGVLALVAVGVGLVAAAADLALTGAHWSVFSDGWRVLPPPAPGSGWGWAIALATAIPLLVAAYLSARGLTPGARPPRDANAARLPRQPEPGFPAPEKPETAVRP